MTDSIGLRDYEAWAKSIREFSWLQGIVPGGMDVDLLIERKGKFLVLEGKPWRDGVVLPWGQHRALFALSKIPQFQVYLVGERDDKFYIMGYRGSPAPQYLRHRSVAFFPPDRFIPTSKLSMGEMVRLWWEANENG